MKSLYNPADNAAIVARIRQLSPESTSQWGKMNVAQMLAHCQVPLQVAFGELKLKRTFIGRLFGKAAKRKLSQDKPWDHNMPTDPHFIVTDEREFSMEQQNLIPLVERFAKEGPGGITTEAHPFFGKLTPEEWSNIQWNHLDHHLRQFGV